MRSLCLLFTLSSTLLSAVATATSLRATTASSAAEEWTSSALHVAFHAWSNHHDKTYDSADERELRFGIWKDNDERIQAHNSKEPRPSYTLAHNQYSDWTQDEFARYYKLGQYSLTSAATSEEYEFLFDTTSTTSSAKRVLYEPDDISTLPDYVNWIQWGAVTPVKNQGACGACWAFSTTGALEGAKFIKTGVLTSLSEQNLLDCDHLDLGCQGGLMDNAFKFDEKSGGLCSEADYPYQAEQGPVCKNCTDVPGSIVKTFVDVPPGNQKALLSAIAMQPISIAIEADQFVFQFYKNGVITDDSCGKSGMIDHGVLAVGYGTDLETQVPYFLVKNSWGETWGDKGYVKIGRNTTNKFGICSILKLASFPIVE